MHPCSDTTLLQGRCPLIAMLRDANSILMIDMPITRTRNRGLDNAFEVFRQELRISDTPFVELIQLFQLRIANRSLKVRHTLVIAYRGLIIAFWLPMITPQSCLFSNGRLIRRYYSPFTRRHIFRRVEGETG